MNRCLKIYLIDSFTRDKFKGNPAGVVLNADGLSSDDMLNISREINASETAFILSPDNDDYDVKIRYFTPTTEVPICGHATIAAHYARSIELSLNSCIVRQKSSIGIIPVEIIKDGTDYSIVMTQDIEFSEPLPPHICSKIIHALKITKDDINNDCPVQVVSTGHSKVMICIKKRSTLNSLSPDIIQLTEISKEIGCNGYFVFTRDTISPDIYTHGRMFAPAIGINEDPVTGNANGPLGAYLVKYGMINHNGKHVTFTGEQGYSIGRSGLVNVTVNIVENEPKQVKIKGNAVIAFKGECII